MYLSDSEEEIFISLVFSMEARSSLIEDLHERRLLLFFG